MAEIRAFRGWRYDLGHVGALADVIAPPYDVIDDALSAALHAKSPYNVIRLILDPNRPTDTDQDNRYTRSARTLKAWQREGALTQDNAPSLYVYHQEFDWEGRHYTRRGVMARVRLEEFGKGRIYPHEETLAGPKADRLKLFHATGMNLSQIFGLYPDPECTLAETAERAVQRQPPLEAVDHLGVVHRLWPLADAEVIAGIQAGFAEKPIFIADGHHRYETGLRHWEERRAAGLIKGPDDPAGFILMMLVGMSEPGLKVMPTHRLVTGLGMPSAARLRELLSEHFAVEALGSGAAAGRRAWESIVASGRQDVLGFGTVADGSWTLARLRAPASMDRVVTDHSPAWKSLGVSILQRLVLDTCLKPLGRAERRYVHLLDEVLEAAEQRSCEVACLVQPARVEHIEQLAGTFEKMPAKSTYFYPKLASGLVFHPIH